MTRIGTKLRGSQRPCLAVSKILNCFVRKKIQPATCSVTFNIPVPNKCPELRQFLVSQFRDGGLDFLNRTHDIRLEDQNVRASRIEANVEMIRVNDGAPRAPHETCLRKTSDP